MKTLKHTFPVVAFLGLSFTFMSCQKLNTYQGSSPDSTGQSSGSVLEHTAEFKTTKLHGTRYLMDPGNGTCFSCHDGEAVEVPETPEAAAAAIAKENSKEKLKDKATKKKACASCHENFPHSKAFKRKHGQVYFDNPETCLSCHGDKQQGRGRAVACSTCHEASHTAEFKTTRVHGATFVKEKKELGEEKVSCWKCHTDKKPAEVAERDLAPNGLSAKRSCGVCHENYPHVKNFDDSKKHAKAFRDDPFDCAKCHGQDFGGTGASASCKECHEFPHVGAWALPSKHGQAFMKEKAGNGAMVSCAECHGSSGNTAGSRAAKIACDTCHYWHLAPGALTADNHAAEATKFRSGCTNCHVGAKKLLPWEKGCFECHEDTTELKVPKDWETLTGQPSRSPQSLLETKKKFSTPKRKAAPKKAK